MITIDIPMQVAVKVLDITIALIQLTVKKMLEAVFVMVAMTDEVD